MTIDIEKYPLAKLPEVSVILSPSSFVRLYADEKMSVQKKTFIHSPDTYNPTKMEFSIVEDDILERGFAIVPQLDTVDVLYLSGILNSYISWAFMTEGKVGIKTSITLKKLGNISVRILPDIIQKKVACLYVLLSDIKQQQKKRIDYPFLDYWGKVYKEVMNAISLELIMPQLFEKYDISVLETWCSLVDNCSESKTGIIIDQLKVALGEELLKPQNQLMGNIRKLRIVLNTITEHAKGEV